MVSGMNEPSNRYDDAVEGEVAQGRELGLYAAFCHGDGLC